MERRFFFASVDLEKTIMSISVFPLSLFLLFSKSSLVMEPLSFAIFVSIIAANVAIMYCIS